MAQVTLLGPRSKQDFAPPKVFGQPSNGSDEEDEEEERWQMLALYTLPSHRGRGIAKRLCLEALHYLSSYRPEPRNVLVRLMVKPGMHATIRFYEKLGFIEVGNCTLAEALIANGDGDILPEGYEKQEKYNVPTAHVTMQGFTRMENR